MPECSDSVTVFSDPDGREIVVIGTAHISEDSAELVGRTIRSIKPDVVMIELDPKRVGRVGDQSLEEAGFDLPPSDGYVPQAQMEKKKVNNFVTAFAGAMAGLAQQAAGALLGKALSQFYNSIEKLGFVAGGEFKAAVVEGKKVGARILLGDRDVDITLQHLAAALSETDQER
jgi:pheromone shutdown protein TraB